MPETCAPQISAKAADEQVLKSQIYLAATKLGARGNYRRAAQQLDVVVAKFPNSPVALYTRALAYHNLGNDDLAVRDTSKAINIDPTSANSYFVRGAALQSAARGGRNRLPAAVAICLAAVATGGRNRLAVLVDRRHPGRRLATLCPSGTRRQQQRCNRDEEREGRPACFMACHQLPKHR